MAALHFTGIGFLIFAFLAAAAESAVRAIFNMKGYFVSGQELWSAISPKTLIFARHAVQDLSPALWDPAILALLSPPAWLVTGIPGLILVIFFRPRHKRNAEPVDEESLYLIDNLVLNARQEGYDDEEGDIGSSLDDGHIYEEATDIGSEAEHDKRAQEDYIKEWDPNDSFPDNLDAEKTPSDQSTGIDSARTAWLDKK
jgi:hypothetical protein